MFIGENKEAHQSATQKLMEAVVHLRRASEALMAVQAMVTPQSDEGQKVHRDRQSFDNAAKTYDAWFLRAAQEYFA